MKKEKHGSVRCLAAIALHTLLGTCTVVWGCTSRRNRCLCLQQRASRMCWADAGREC